MEINIRKRYLLLLLALFMVYLPLLSFGGQSSTNYNLPSDVISGGGEAISSTGYKTTSTAGQSSALGTSTSAGYMNYGGFWSRHIVNTVKKGDVNGDGNVTIVDALFVARYAAGLSVASFNIAAADVNCDGNINIVDALLIARKAAGLAVPNWCP